MNEYQRQGKSDISSEMHRMCYKLGYPDKRTTSYCVL